MEKPKSLTAFQKQIRQTRAMPQLTKLKTDLLGLIVAGERATKPRKIVDSVIRYVTSKIEHYGEELPPAELARVSKALDVAQSINNNPKLGELRARIAGHGGKVFGQGEE